MSVKQDQVLLLIDGSTTERIADLVVSAGQKLHHLRYRREDLEQIYHSAIAA